MRIPIALFAIFASLLALADESIDPNIKKYLVIAATETSYEKARSIAELLAKKTRIKIDYRGLAPHKRTGLSLTKEGCLENQTQDFPCYLKRGKYDDGEYISIEYSNEYKELKPGFYLVITYSGSKNEADKNLKKVVKIVSDAFIRNFSVSLAGE